MRTSKERPQTHSSAARAENPGAKRDDRTQARHQGRDDGLGFMLRTLGSHERLLSRE